jgi:ABC-type Mn2+/Zn2+ transport system ATPase subunit
VDPELEALGNRRVDHLSRGWTRRVLLAFLVAGRPPLLLLDEPSSGVDATAGPGVAHLLRRAARAGATIIVATHDTGVARAADRALLLVRGTLREVTRGLGASGGALPSTNRRTR